MSLRKFFIAAFFLLGLVANSFALSSEFTVKINEDNSATINKAGYSKKISLSHLIFGYTVDCEKRYVLFWGKSKKLNPNNPQDSILTIYNSITKKSSLPIGFSKNIFDVSFLNEKNMALVETDTEELLKLTEGKLIVGNSTIEKTDMEKCADFPFKSYKKFER